MYHAWLGKVLTLGEAGERYIWELSLQSLQRFGKSKIIPKLKGLKKNTSL